MNAIDTAYDDLTNTLKSSDWFDAHQFPQAIFESNSFKKTGDKTYQAVGNLTLRGKTQPVTLDFTLENYSANNMVLNGSTTLKRTAFGVGQGDWSKTDAVKDEVRIDFKIVAHN